MSLTSSNRHFSGHIIKGTVLTADQINAIAARIVASISSNSIHVSHIGTAITIDVPRVRAGVGAARTFLAKITGNSAITANSRWKYAWSEVIIDSDADAVLTGGRTGTTSTDYALNLVEINNGAAGVLGGDGVNAAGADYPAGFKRRPIGGGGTTDTHTNDVLVVMHVVIDDDDDKRFVFSQPNAHDGTCDA